MPERTLDIKLFVETALNSLDQKSSAHDTKSVSIMSKRPDLACDRLQRMDGRP